MEKIDFKKELKELYRPSAKKIVTIDVPEMNFIMIDGKGDPNNSAEYQDAVEALFSVSYTLKFMIKRGEIEIDYGVMPLEGLWWADDMSSFVDGKKDDWKWTSMIMQPEFVTKAMFQEASEQVIKKKGLKAVPKLRFDSYKEGVCAQVLHIGPFSEEGPTIQKLHEYIEEKGFRNSGKHHEIYLSDFRRTAPEKLKTVIRQPMA